MPANRASLALLAGTGHMPSGRLNGVRADLACRCDYPSRRQGGETMT
jgi:hypothetical protein